MQKLVYKNYKNCRDIITIDLHNDYSVIAVKSYDQEEHNYYVDLYLKEKSVDKLDLIETAESLKFSVDYKTINSAILKHIATLLSENFFDYYINRYEYELKCFDRGNELFEKERLGDI